ncbi:hypothetical protein VOLCADRAFT_86627 [Volvox carteri f. nagariensis]|uniref:Uncharacterized protein n=1 Tax=Volvox carteri f. nagariensis TaxID=3068 RepID=D8TJ63_VOLCA|nr:uncharacterized protein VOLCADRAFT_86627 [Volvox carteri f. nagariensis]EFJ52321.1 hypothetical protein VOLCADRAFT_86627 [Volvox carteri f. nagariensis]|eukprot:XP_002946394.1 hypothetical protein VOLCADRAFT_86627 [Volvox carteri f. nagariensis]
MDGCRWCCRAIIKQQPVALPLMTLWEAASDAEWRRGNVAMNVVHAMTGAMMQLPHVKWSYMTFRCTAPNTRVAAGVQVDRPPGCASAVSVPDGILWSDQPNSSLPASMTDVELDAAKTRVMVTPVLGRVPVKQGDLAAVQVWLHDITGPTPVVVCSTAPQLKRAAEVVMGEVQAGVPKHPLELRGGAAHHHQSGPRDVVQPDLHSCQVALLNWHSAQHRCDHHPCFGSIQLHLQHVQQPVVDDPATVDLVWCKVAALDVGQLWSKLSQHKAAGSAMHKVDMVGHAYIATDSSNMAGCLVQAVHPIFACWVTRYAPMCQHDAECLQPGVCFSAATQLAEAIYTMATKHFPCMAALRQVNAQCRVHRRQGWWAEMACCHGVKLLHAPFLAHGCREKLVTSDTARYLLGGTPFNLVARTSNEGVQLHLVTLVMLAAGALEHSTIVPVVPPGSEAVQMGLSVFVRPWDVQQLLACAINAGVSQELQAMQVQVQEWLMQAKTACSCVVVCEAAKAERAAVDALPGGAAVDRLFVGWQAPSVVVGLQATGSSEINADFWDGEDKSATAEEVMLHLSAIGQAVQADMVVEVQLLPHQGSIFSALMEEGYLPHQ